MAVGVKTAPEREALVVKLYQAGVGRDEISERTGCAQGTIDTILKRNGVTSGRAAPPVPPERRELVKRLCLEGRSYAEIGIEVGITKNAVAGILSRMGVKQPAKAKARDRSRGKTGAVLRPQKSREPKQPKPKPSFVCLAPQEDEMARKRLADLCAHECKWPIGSVEEGCGHEQLFCGRPTDCETPYCDFHYNRSVDRLRLGLSPGSAERDLERMISRFAA